MLDGMVGVFACACAWVASDKRDGCLSTQARRLSVLAWKHKIITSTQGTRHVGMHQTHQHTLCHVLGGADTSQAPKQQPLHSPHSPQHTACSAQLCYPWHASGVYGIDLFVPATSGAAVRVMEVLCLPHRQPFLTTTCASTCPEAPPTAQAGRPQPDAAEITALMRVADGVRGGGSAAGRAQLSAGLSQAPVFVHHKQPRLPTRNEECGNHQRPMRQD